MKAPASRRGAALQAAMTPLLGAFLASSPRLFDPAHPESSGLGEIARIGGYWMRLLQAR
jgi:hypothetical protein